ncbi:TPA: metal-dependent hydrolase [Staphylococcus argenteus]|uniref:Putative membrane protein n=1 Tax=Staphylococcus argenteus TaxID=985002 RepID=A0A7U7PWK8_9STAP|nr:metal-dependent hydrolase [Staphylococcus argenteus]BBN31524.1 membrane-bound metal-dependent hydrolase [Staphylococcus aureus]ATY57633.1 metal-dependent hydrolase [Staphylococcus argenteus]ATZ87856.1 metal-dependent hydrolase [Staphylococcus argenteus]EKF1504820.1 metal-dependent hydrolase [Staphylococcus argenteus]EYG89667.1 inner membrane protein [Staphylococcus argenteus]
MTGKTHASCGMLVGAITTQYFQTDIFSSVTIIILATIASLLPDICHTQSKIGRRFKLASFLIRLIFGHRTFTHSILFIGIITILLHIIQTPSYYMVAIIIGLLSHVILDMMTPKGVKLFYPLPFNVRFPIQFKTGGLVDLSLATALMVGTVYVLFQPFINDIINNWNTKFF